MLLPPKSALSAGLSLQSARPPAPAAAHHLLQWQGAVHYSTLKSMVPGSVRLLPDTELQQHKVYSGLARVRKRQQTCTKAGVHSKSAKTLKEV